MQFSRSSKICVLVLVLFTYTLNIFAQIPPTCCPDPLPVEDDFNSTPYVIAAGGLVVLGGSYFYLKNKGPKIAIQDHLPSYLLSRNILPNEDALSLMYSLNPSLDGKENIRENKKLVVPDFPAPPNEKLNQFINSTGLSSSNSQLLRDQIGILRSNIGLQRTSNIPYKPEDSIFSKELESNLFEIERVLLTIEKNITQSNDVINSLIVDLISELNQTLEIGRTSRTNVENDSNLIQNILDDLKDISSSDISGPNLEQSSINSLWYDQEILLASNHRHAPYQNLIEQSEKIITEPDTKGLSRNSNLLKGFAFAVYTVGENGEPVTKGAEVEGRFMVKFAMPALKDEVRTHKDTDGLASYALAMLPPAKLFIIVTDISDGGKIIPLQNPLIDFKVAFRNLGRETINDQEFIIVPIYLAK